MNYSDKFWLTNWQTNEEEDFSPPPPSPIKCPKCKIGHLDIWHDIHGMYHKCSHCKWDSIGLYKTKNKYEKYD